MPPRSKSKFTLVELLVVVSIISVLAAMLLPALGSARERARRISCLSNLRQTYMAAVIYSDDSGDSLPEPGIYPKNQEYTNITSSWGNSANLLSLATQSHGNTLGIRTGWWNFLVGTKYTYIDRQTVNCPSMSSSQYRRAGSWPNSGFLVDYDYRYNNEISGNYTLTADKPNWYTTRALADTDYYVYRPLFHEAAGYRRIKPDCYFTYDQSESKSKLEWAHRDGGNVVTHGGDGYWVANYFHPDLAYGNSFSWPSGGIFTFYERSTSGKMLGLDVYAQRAR